MQTFPQLQPFAVKVAARPCCYPFRRRFAVTCQRTFSHPNPSAKVRLSLDFEGGFRGQLFPVSFRWLKTLYIVLFLPSSGLGRPLVLPFSGEPYGGGFLFFAFLFFSLCTKVQKNGIYSPFLHVFCTFGTFFLLLFRFSSLLITPCPECLGAGQTPYSGLASAAPGSCFLRTRRKGDTAGCRAECFLEC